MHGRLIILLILGLAFIAFGGVYTPTAQAYCDGAAWNIAHENFSPSEGHTCTQFGDVDDEDVTSTFSPFSSVLIILTTAGGTWEGSQTICYNCTLRWLNLPHGNDKVGCYNHHTADQWVNCKHDDCTYPTVCLGPWGSPPPSKEPGAGVAEATGPKGFGTIPFASVKVDEAVRSWMLWNAASRGIDAGGLTAVGAIGLGSNIYGPVVGSDSAGSSFVAFMGGSAYSDFARVRELVGAKGLYVHTAAMRTESGIEAGVVGLVASAVNHVTMEDARGTTTDVPLKRWGMSPWASFTVAAPQGAAAPRVVRTYDRSDSLLAMERLPTEPINIGK